MLPLGELVWKRDRGMVRNTLLRLSNAKYCTELSPSSNPSQNKDTLISTFDHHKEKIKSSEYFQTCF